MYLSSQKEKKLSKEFLNNGYLIKKVCNQKDLNKIKKIFENFLQMKLKIKNNNNLLFDQFHKIIKKKNLNSIRLDLISYINKNDQFKSFYYNICRDYLDALVGNELVMQNNINLSIQLPRDGDSLLPLHSDVWSGDSPYEIVVWLPLVDCYRTKSMYILQPKDYKFLISRIKKHNLNDGDKLFKSVEKKVKWLKVNYGEVLIFNQSLPHGNRINKESSTRWSMNCRFKSVFSPYGDKKFGEFFKPITLKPMSEIGMNYTLPNIDRNEKN